MEKIINIFVSIYFYISGVKCKKDLIYFLFVKLNIYFFIQYLKI